MIKVKNYPVSIRKIDLKSGTGKKSGKEYSFYIAKLVDADGDKYEAIVGRELEMNGEVPDYIKEMATPCSAQVDLDLETKGFNIAATLVAVELDD